MEKNRIQQIILFFREIKECHCSCDITPDCDGDVDDVVLSVIASRKIDDIKWLNLSSVSNDETFVAVVLHIGSVVVKCDTPDIFCRMLAANDQGSEHS